MEFQKAIRFPEWKQLFDSILQLIDQGQRQFSYEELDKLGSINSRTGRGRAQFYRFRKELLKTRQLWLENISNYGYGVIEPGDHPNAAYRRVNQARRRINTAKAINNNIRIEDLTSEQRLLQAGMAAILHELSKTFHAVGHRFAIASKDPSKLAINLEELTKSIEPKTKRIAPGSIS